MDAHEGFPGEDVLGGLHGKVRHQRLLLRTQVHHQVVLHPFDIEDIGIFHLPQDAVGLQIDPVLFLLGGRGGAFLQREPLPALLHRLQELLVTDGFEQEVQRAHFVAFKGVLLEGRGKDDTGLRRKHAGEFQSVQVRHLDIQEGQFRSQVADFGQRQDGVVERSQQLQLRRTCDVPLQHLYGQRFVIDYYATEILHCVQNDRTTSTVYLPSSAFCL